MKANKTQQHQYTADDLTIAMEYYDMLKGINLTEQQVETLNKLSKRSLVSKPEVYALVGVLSADVLAMYFSTIHLIKTGDNKYALFVFGMMLPQLVLLMILGRRGYKAEKQLRNKVNEIVAQNNRQK